MSNNMNIKVSYPKWFTLDHKIAFFFRCNIPRGALVFIWMQRGRLNS